LVQIPTAGVRFEVSNKAFSFFLGGEQSQDNRSKSQQQQQQQQLLSSL
jgi:hypothetical protein